MRLRLFCEGLCRPSSLVAGAPAYLANAGFAVTYRYPVELPASGGADQPSAKALALRRGQRHKLATCATNIMNATRKGCAVHPAAARQSGSPPSPALHRRGPARLMQVVTRPTTSSETNPPPPRTSAPRWTTRSRGHHSGRVGPTRTRINPGPPCSGRGPPASCAAAWQAAGPTASPGPDGQLAGQHARC